MKKKTFALLVLTLWVFVQAEKKSIQISLPGKKHKEAVSQWLVDCRSFDPPYLEMLEKKCLNAIIDYPAAVPSDHRARSRKVTDNDEEENGYLKEMSAWPSDLLHSVHYLQKTDVQLILIKGGPGCRGRLSVKPIQRSISACTGIRKKHDGIKQKKSSILELPECKHRYYSLLIQG